MEEQDRRKLYPSSPETKLGKRVEELEAHLTEMREERDALKEENELLIADVNAYRVFVASLVKETRQRPYWMKRLTGLFNDYG